MNATILDRFVGNISPVALLVSSFFWSWFDIVPFSPLLFTMAGVPYRMEPLAVSLAVSALVLALCATSSRLRSVAINPKSFAVCSLMCGTGGAVLIYLGACMSLPALLLEGGVLIGVYEGTGAMVVGSVVTCQGTTNALIHLAAALPFNIIAVLIAAFLQPVASVVFTGALPLLAAVCFAVFTLRGHNLATLKSTLVVRAPRAASVNGIREVFTRNGQFLLMVLVVAGAFGFVNMQAMSYAGDDPFVAYVSLVIRAVASAVIFVGYLRFSWRPYTILGAALLLMAVSLVISGITQSGFADYLFLTGYLFFDVLIWALLLMLNYRSGIPLLRTICIVYAVDQFAIFIGTVAAFGAVDENTVATGCVILGCALLLLMVWLSNSKTSFKEDLSMYAIEFDELKGTCEPTHGGDVLESSIAPVVREGHIAELTARYFLSTREVDILTLLVAGRNGPYIAEHLCVSDNTVKTHIRHIYTKLDVHNRQELLDLVFITEK